jgi:hypothetical protein
MEDTTDELPGALERKMTKFVPLLAQRVLTLLTGKLGKECILNFDMLALQ